MKYYELQEISEKLDREIQFCGAVLSGDDYLGTKHTGKPKVPSDKIRREFKRLEKTIKNMKTVIGRRCAAITLKNKEIEALKSKIKKQQIELEAEREHQGRLISKHREIKYMLLAERSKKQ